jgi:hypothetical protein
VGIGTIGSVTRQSFSWFNSEAVLDALTHIARSAICGSWLSSSLGRRLGPLGRASSIVPEVPGAHAVEVAPELALVAAHLGFISRNSMMGPARGFLQTTCSSQRNAEIIVTIVTIVTGVWAEGLAEGQAESAVTKTFANGASYGTGSAP